MAGRQTHRGAAPQDERLFARDQLGALRAAASDLCWLLDRHYAARSALELVGNRHNLSSRQRMALARYACSSADVQCRTKSRVESADVRGQELWLDGYNILTVLESALAGGVVLPGRDGCFRDIAGIHRRYRKVNETMPALKLVGETVLALGAGLCRWLLDQPVSNSGRLKTLILETAQEAGWNMEVELTFSPDHLLARTNHIIATSDGIVLDQCRQWVNLAAIIMAQRIPRARVVDLGFEHRTSNFER
ncbi:MAG TPA: DUF434 domain-containing protein [Candidatus Sulfotelmatobacter sp.]|nr:DUF434 domain-containing protein [Candidatus Sulfotelmatobacter sp.]